MPLTTTFATLSARGFGLFGRQKVLTTVTFPSGTTTWTAPFGVTSLVSLVGKGQDGSAGFFYTANQPQIYNASLSGATGLGNAPPAPDYTISCVNAIISFINGYSGLQYVGGSTFSPTISLTVSAVDGTWTTPTTGSTTLSSWDGGGWIVGGSASVYSQLGGRQVGVEYQTYSFPFDGANTTAFGYTFPGGVAGPASPVTYNNVPVTPGTTYTIVNNGSVTITYYV
jgi:hypothetical protein